MRKLCVLLLPIALRQAKFTAWLKTLASPLVTIKDAWSKNRDNSLYILRHNGQVCYLRKTLNDNFDIAQRRIEITNGNRYERNYIYTYAEENPRYLRSVWLRKASDFADTGVDFIVLVPRAVNFHNHEIQALINYYKLASKRYKIVHT